MSTRMSINDVLYALADSLDYVEHEIFGASANHSRRVAYMSVKMGREYGLHEKELLNLAASAVLHDNAITEYNQSELNMGVDVLSDKADINLKSHCVMGENNVSTLPYFRETKGTVLYHHEEADSTGPFELKPEETPLFSQIIHIADIVDVAFDTSKMNHNKYERIINFVDENRGKRFDGMLVDTFIKVCSYEVLCQLDDGDIHELLKKDLPKVPVDYTNENLEGIAAMFAKIVDYKSSFTCIHSKGVANKARAMARYYGYCDEDVAKMYFAGALHDIGKLVINNDILGKPDKLTNEEYVQMQNHAYASWEILGRIEGIEDIRSWASLHHEKLDGSGYPFGKTADELGINERIMACIDIYQALFEDRPYKLGMPHKKVIEIMRNEVKRGKLDKKIVEDVDNCFETLEKKGS